MSSVQIYYTCSERLKQSNVASGIDIDAVVPYGSMNSTQLYTEIKNDPYFCRGEESIDYTYFTSLIRNDLSLYALVDTKVAGALSFMFNIKNGERIINLNGLCSPVKYAGIGVGQSLIRALIRIAKQTRASYIYLDCKGDVMQYYRDKFGFEVTNAKSSYDSDDDDDDNAGVMYYYMRLNVSNAVGGYRTRATFKKTIKRRKRKHVSRRKRRFRK